MSNLFESAKPTSQPSPTPEDTDPLIALVGEGKKFKDAASLAKGKLEADKHIERLEGEMQGLRQELEQRLSLEKFLDKLEQGAEPKAPEVITPPVQSQTITPEDIAKTVKQVLSTEKEVSTRQSNVDFVRSQLEKAWGKDYLGKLEQVASELGAKKDLEVLAETNPKLFLQAVGIGQQQTTTVDTNAITPPRTTLSLGSNTSSSSRENYTSFEKMRKEDPKTYWSTANQMRMHEVAEKMGDAFFS